MRQDRTLLLYELVKGYEVNVGKIIEKSILDYEQGKFSGNIPYSCVSGGGGGGGGGGLNFNEAEEERCPKASPLTLARVNKALVERNEGERREKTKKRKKAETLKEPMELAPTVVSNEGASSKEIGEYEAYEEQPVLSFTVD